MQQQLKDKDPPGNAQHYYTEQNLRESKEEYRVIVIGHSFFPEESGEEDDT